MRKHLITLLALVFLASVIGTTACIVHTKPGHRRHGVRTHKKHKKKHGHGHGHRRHGHRR